MYNGGEWSGGCFVPNDNEFGLLTTTSLLKKSIGLLMSKSTKVFFAVSVLLICLSWCLAFIVVFLSLQHPLSWSSLSWSHWQSVFNEIPKNEHDLCPPHSCTSILNPTVENRCEKIKNMEIKTFIIF